jgi:TonB family protein
MKPALLLAILAVEGMAQGTEPYRIGGDVKAPTLIQKREPTYSQEARDAMVSGEVWFEAVVTETGQLDDLVVISPLGWGLEEKAEEAIRGWKFRPGTKAGQPVPIQVTIAVSFRIGDGFVDKKKETQRGQYNLALHNLKRGDDKSRKSAIETFGKLAQEKFAPAMWAYAGFLREGKDVAADPIKAFELVQRAAGLKYGPAVYEIGKMYLRGEQLPRDPDRGRDMIVTAANLGSNEAQYFLGRSHELGSEGFEKSADSARQFFRLCAAQGQGVCQYRLGLLLLNREGRRESDFAQAIAWLELAQEQGIPDAGLLLAPHQQGLTASQRSDAQQFKSKLVPKK